ncbi:hypothetical protein EVAR_44014_1 [Eumeta japonica]|uniref:Uncharacterized protein n=1 Tax=Eumeta variegata TaxID=151549 RepID=A0A4C1XED3_EUMVA|nr:hypothetical protein EVAR_44014_1 [Eumeta japonica]
MTHLRDSADCPSVSEVVEWFIINNLVLNETKTKLVPISLSNTKLVDTNVRKSGTRTRRWWAAARTSRAPTARGCAAWRTLRLAAGARAAARGLLRLRCAAALPTRPPHARSVPVWLHVGAAPQVSVFTANGEAVVAAGAGAARAAGRARAHPPWALVLLLTTKCLHL